MIFDSKKYPKTRKLQLLIDKELRRKKSGFRGVLEHYKIRSLQFLENIIGFEE